MTEKSVNKNAEREDRLLKYENQYRRGRVLAIILLIMFVIVEFILLPNVQSSTLNKIPFNFFSLTTIFLLVSIYINSLYVKHIDSIKYYRKLLENNKESKTKDI